MSRAVPDQPVSGDESVAGDIATTQEPPPEDDYRHFTIVGQLRENVWNDAGDDFTERQPDRDETEYLMDFLADWFHAADEDGVLQVSLGGSLANADIHISFSVPFSEDAS